MPGTRGRRSDAEVVAAVRAAVVEELIDVGLGKLTMDGIAQRAGIAKTSLYRRWDSPQTVLLDALRNEYPQERPTPAPTDDLRHDLIEADPELAESIYAQVFEPKGGRFTSTVLRHYADAGRIDPDLLTPVVVDIGEALVLKFSLDAGELPGDRILADIVDQAILPAVGYRR
jgi:AcrR family transcriptional regulator